MRNSKKLIELEALRGIAAIVVLIHHFMLGFTPRLHGLLNPDQAATLFGTPAFAFVNGTAAVILFFVLSGFVLTAGLFRSPGIARAIVAIVKRWPRLAATVMLANCVAGALMAFNLYGNLHAAPLTQSEWLGKYYTWQSTGTAEIGKALFEGATTFFTAENFYNNGLWTMYYEFYGSVASIVCAFVAANIPSRAVRNFIFIASWFGLFFWSPYLSPFIAGVWLASRQTYSAWSNLTALLVIIPLLLLMGYSENFTSHLAEGWYTSLNGLVANSPAHVRIFLHTGGAVLAMMLFLRVDAIKRTMSGKFGKQLGFLSFGIYLAQVPVICSLSSWVFVSTVNTPSAVQMLLTIFATIAGVLLLAIPLATFDRWWVRKLNVMVGALRIFAAEVWQRGAREKIKQESDSAADARLSRSIAPCSAQCKTTRK